MVVVRDQGIENVVWEGKMEIGNEMFVEQNILMENKCSIFCIFTCTQASFHTILTLLTTQSLTICPSKI